MIPKSGRSRVVIERVRPEVDCGRFPIKRTVGGRVDVEAHIFADGHDLISAVVCYRGPDDQDWNEAPLKLLVNDEWQGSFAVEVVGDYRYTVLAWIDRFVTWRHDLEKRLAAGQDVSVDLLIGADLVAEAAEQASGDDSEKLSVWARRLRDREAIRYAEVICSDEELTRLMARHSPRQFATTYRRELGVLVDRERGGFSSWYEMFPRSAASEPGQHGTFDDCIKRLPYVQKMGFDVLYLPPIHPVGSSFRKGRNNQVTAEPDDVGSPWAIGAEEGGHKSILSELGTLADFHKLVKAAKEMGIDLALDIAFQCSPDHPYVKEHPEWFRQRPDGTIQYAENPPKKYQDIYPFNFECDDWKALWEELASIFFYWIEQGVKVFRVDNPHTKPFAFWEWCIGKIREKHPDVLFLSEAFTRPKIMYRLAKLGFTQSYTYFAWRNTKHELTEYLNELTKTEVAEYCRPNFWPNTPDILTEELQVGGRPAFMSRLVLAATLSANYGIYGPPFEHCWGEPREPGSEEYLNSEKYEVHYHDIDRPDSLKDFIGRVNRIRRESSAFQRNDTLLFHHVSNDHLICYSKHAPDLSEIFVMVVNLDSHFTQSGWVELPLDVLNIDSEHPYQVHELLGGARYVWHGPRNYVELDPHIVPAHIFRVRRHLRTERDFEYYL